MIKYLNFKKSNSPRPLAILKIDPPKKEVEIAEPQDEGEDEPLEIIDESPVKDEPKLDIPNYDEIERKWNFSQYDSLVSTLPKKCSTVAALLSACVA